MRHNKGLVCLGASTGGLEPFRTILSNLSNATGFSFVIIQHQPPDAEPLLAEILARDTSMPVELVTDGARPLANHVYVVPPGKDAEMSEGKLRLYPRAPRIGWPENISRFLRTLASDQREAAIAVILSGLAFDGADSLQAIQENGGIVIAQQFDTAQEADMPTHAVETGHVDFILSPHEIAIKLEQIASLRESDPRWLHRVT